MNRQRRISIQLWVAVVLTMAGIILIFCGFWVAPTGQIHSSVLVAFGEMATFAGGLLGVDYSYRFKRLDSNKTKEKEKDERD